VSPNQQQFEAWNGGESVHYVEHSDRYDRQLAPFAEALFERAQPEAHDAVLDVGCGCGATTLTAARRARRAVGVDISIPLLEVAEERARSASLDNAEFVVADAQTHAFDRGTFDVVVSQFGVMFFDDPPSAFANLRAAVVPGGRLVFVCWQGLEANEWLCVVGDAVAPHADLPSLGGLAGGPGMFALKDPDETSALLTVGGFNGIEVEPIAPTIVLGGGGTLDDSMEFLLGMGMVRGLLGRVEAGDRPAAMEALRASLAERYEPGIGVGVGAAGWLVSAWA
jgi:SAM-dependent methyltransferase